MAEITDPHARESMQRLREIMQRLDAIYRNQPILDKAQAEAALVRHFEELGLAPRPVRWVQDAEQGTLAAVRASAVESAPWSMMVGTFNWLDLDPSLDWAAAMRAAMNPAWRAARRAATKSAWQAARRAVMWPAESAARAASMSAVASACHVNDPAVEREIGIWLPLLEAAEAGLWLFWVTAPEVIAVPRPVLRRLGGQLHGEDGPAVWWPDGACYYFWRGVQVPEKVIMAPWDLTVKDIRHQRNVAVRRVMLQQYGEERFLRDSGAQLLQEDRFGQLYRQELPHDEPLVMVRVLNSTPEATGEQRIYWLRVPPWTQTAHEGVAWSFGLTPAQYDPVVET